MADLATIAEIKKSEHTKAILQAVLATIVSGGSSDAKGNSETAWGEPPDRWTMDQRFAKAGVERAVRACDGSSLRPSWGRQIHGSMCS